jgi:lysophospholipase L1-like esterase
MSRFVPLLLAALLALGACTAAGDAATPDRDTTLPERAADAAPPPTRAAPEGPEAQTGARTEGLTAELPQLEPGLTDAVTFAGEPLLIGIGDSIAAGSGLLQRRDGLVWRVHRALAEDRPDGYGMENLAVPGATSGSLLAGEQLQRAEDLLAQMPVDTVLITVGGNDLLALFGDACGGGGIGTPACGEAIGGAVASFESNLDQLLARLTTAGPDARIVVLQQYNPLDLGLGFELERVSTEATLALNEAATRAAQRHGAVVVDGYTPLEGRITAVTGMGDQQPDIHPNALGHDLLAVAVLDALAQ